MVNNSTTLRLFRNILSITFLQTSSYVLALVNVPYLTRTLGVSDYGVLSLTVSINAYLYVVIDWGFSLGATREVARAQNNPAALREIFWRTMTAKGLLAIVALVTLLSLSASDDAISVSNIILPSILNILGAVLSVDWLALGLERMGIFSVVSIVGRTLVIGLMFCLVHGPKDTWIACGLQGLSSLVASLAGFLLICRYFVVGRPSLPVRVAARQIWDYRHYFLSQSSRIAYTTVAPVLLALSSGSAQVGLFTGAERIVRAAMGLVVPVGTALYPYINALVAHSRGSAASAAGLLMAAEVFFGMTLALFFLLCANPVIEIILGPEFSYSIGVLRCLAVLPLLAAISGTLSNQCLIPLGWHREVSRILVVCTLSYLGMLAVLTCYIGPLGAAIALDLAGILTSVWLGAFVWQHERAFALGSLAAIRGGPGRILQLSGGWL